MILPDVDTSPTFEAMKRGQWPEANPQVAEAWRRLRGFEFPVGETENDEEERDGQEG